MSLQAYKVNLLIKQNQTSHSAFYQTATCWSLGMTKNATGVPTCRQAWRIQSSDADTVSGMRASLLCTLWNEADFGILGHILSLTHSQEATKLSNYWPTCVSKQCWLLNPCCYSDDLQKFTSLKIEY